MIYYFLAISIAFSPFVGYGVLHNAQREFAAATIGTSGAEFLNPHTWVKIFQENIAVPALEKELKNSSTTTVTVIQTIIGLKLKALNEDAKNKTGIDVIKFFSWISGFIKSLFREFTTLVTNFQNSVKVQQ